MTRLSDATLQRSANVNPSASAPSSSARNRKRVLVVEDERDLLDLITYNLTRSGYHPISAQNGNEALELIARETPDLILLDLMLPGIDGTEVARRLKSDPATAQIPLIMVTARGEETDVVVGLTLGADDYITKPFSMKILLARINVALRRGDADSSAQSTANLLRAGPLVIDPSRHEAAVNDEAIKLTLTEFKLLLALVQARGRVLSRNQLMDKALGTDVFVTDRAIDVHVTSIRKKLGESNWLVYTVRGVGYRIQESPGAEE